MKLNLEETEARFEEAIHYDPLCTPTTISLSLDDISTLIARIRELEQAQRWIPISELNRNEMRFVEVTQDECVRLYLWNPHGFFEKPDPIGKRVTEFDSCSEPTHFRQIIDELPKAPESK